MGFHLVWSYFSTASGFYISKTLIGGLWGACVGIGSVWATVYS